MSAVADVEFATTAALVAILDAAAEVVTLTGRPNGNIVPENDITDIKGPLLMYEVDDIAEVGGAGMNYQARFRITAVAKGPGARAKTANLLQTVRTLVTEPALSAQGLDACPIGDWRRSRIPLSPDASRDLAGAVLNLTLLVSQ